MARMVACSRVSSWPRILSVALALAAVAIPILALQQYGWTALETHGDGTEFMLWAVLVLGALTAAALGGVRLWIGSTHARLFLAGSEVLVLGALLYTGVYLDACMQLGDGQNPPFLSPSTW
jgi:hypothetical protein